jgi:hypothetical protein
MGMEDIIGIARARLTVSSNVTTSVAVVAAR